MNDINHIGQLKPDPKNARKHNQRNIGQIVSSLQEVGAARSIVIDEDDVILAGNGVIEAAGIAGIENVRVIEANGNEIIAVKRTGLTPEQKTRLALWDNRAAELAEWDVDQLQIDFDSGMLEGLFTDIDLDKLGLETKGEQQEDAEPQIDKAEELREKWGVQTGQLWQLGEHRLICGDCTDKAAVYRLMDGEKADMLLNDPPYGMRLDADFSGMKNHLDFANDKGVKNGNKYSDVIGDDKDYDAKPIMTIFQDTKEQFWWGADYYSSTLGDTMHTGAWLVWDKRLEESADKMYGSCFEMLWSKQKHKRDIIRHKWAGIFGTENEPQRGRLHPNQKPIVLYEDLLNRYSKDGWVIVDCYVGSGTTLIACERLNRKCRAVEISPAYCAVAIQRWVDVTGQEPILLDT